MSATQYTQGCRKLDSVVPLKPGETHCPYCEGYGGHPIPPPYRHFGDAITIIDPPRCTYCGGTGKGAL